MDQLDVRLLISSVVVLNVSARLKSEAIPRPEQKSGTKEAMVRTRSWMFFLTGLQFCGSFGSSEAARNRNEVSTRRLHRNNDAAHAEATGSWFLSGSS